MHITDWLPTFISMAGGSISDIPGAIDGIDQWIALRDDKPSPRDVMLYNIKPKIEKSNETNAGIRQGPLCYLSIKAATAPVIIIHFYF